MIPIVSVLIIASVPALYYVWSFLAMLITGLGLIAIMGIFSMNRIRDDLVQMIEETLDQEAGALQKAKFR
jgi:hypothetical protein